MSNPIQHKFAGAIDVGVLYLDGTKVTATADDLNSISGGTATGNKKYSNASVTAAGTNQATATAMTADLNIVSSADGTKGVKLMTAVDGYSVTVINTSTTAILKVYPATGGAINSLGANTAFSIGPDKQAVFDATSTTQWYTQGDAARTATVAEENVLAGVTAGTVSASKAVVADANKDVAGGRYITLGTNGASGTVGALKLSDGQNPGYTAIVQTDAQSADLTVHFPDPGAIVDSYVAMSTAALTAAEVDVLDGAVAGNSVASKAALLDSNKRVQTNSNNGTPQAGVTAVHYGDGVNVTAVLTLTNVVITVGSSENLGVGSLLYTLPTGACLIRDAYMSVAIAGVTTTTDTPDVGLGTVIASGAVVTLDGTATFENIITGQTASDTNGTATVKGTGPTAGAPLEITTGGAHTVYLNAADGWGANADAAGTLNGTVVISYIRQAA